MNFKNNIVCKFGGSSVCDAKHIKKVAEIIKNNKNRKYIVFSAPGKRHKNDEKITDLLIELKEKIDNKKNPEKTFNKILERFLSIRNTLKIDFDIKTELLNFYSKAKSGKSKDYILSRGEYFNSLLIANYLGYPFLDAKDLIKFENRKINESKTKRNIKSKIKNTPVVIPGFYGSNNKGEIVTFSRGGSDITGSIIASALEVGLYENWTDVSGFLMADPKVVNKPKVINELTFDELRELSYMGASVLHEESVFPLRNCNTKINIKNTNRPNDKGTFISKTKKYSRNEIITGISGKKGFVVIAIYKNMMASLRSFPFKVLSIFNDLDILVEHMPSGIDTISVIIPASQYEKKYKEIFKLIESELSPNKINIIKNISLIATVGEAMAKRKGTAAKLFTSLKNANVNVKLIDQGSSEMNIIIGVSEMDYKKSINAIYKAFVK